MHTNSRNHLDSPAVFPGVCYERHSRMTSTLYVALISPARLDTLQVYLPLCSGIRFFKLSVHFLWRPWPTSCSVSGLSSFSHTMSGRGFPPAVHLSRTELPTGRAITLFLILAGWVKRGGTWRWRKKKKTINRSLLISKYFSFHLKFDIISNALMYLYRKFKCPAHHHHHHHQKLLLTFFCSTKQEQLNWMDV